MNDHEADRHEHVDDLLPFFINRTLDPEEMARVRVHLRRCSVCGYEIELWESIAAGARNWMAAVSTTDGIDSLPAIATTASVEEEAALERIAPVIHIEHRASARPWMIQSRLKRVAAICAVLAIALVTVQTISSGWWPDWSSPDTVRPKLPAAQMSSTPLAANLIPSPEECRVEPVTNERLTQPEEPERLPIVSIPENARDGGTYLQIPVEDLPSGQPASSATIAEITAMLRKATACANARDIPRYWSFFTDDHLRRQNSLFPFTEDDPLALIATPGPFPPERQEFAPMLYDARVFEDGRIGAIDVSGTRHSGPGLHFAQYYIVANEEGRWMIDQIVTVEQYVLTVTSIDLAFVPSDVSVPANTDIIVALHNTGMAKHNFTIDEVGVSLDIAPGESQVVTINVPVGEYTFYSNYAGHRQVGMVGSLHALGPGTSPAG